MSLWIVLLLFSAGTVAGWLNVMAGGGSMLTVPIMLFLGIPGPVANGTNRIAILAQNITAVSTFFQRGYSDFRLSLSLAAAAVPGAVAGAMIGVRLDGKWFERTLAVIMILVMILMWRKRTATATASGPIELTPKRLVLGHIAMAGAGFWGGFIQIGVGFVLMPILHRILGLDLVRVNMHKVFIVLVFTVAALAIYAHRLELLWGVGVSLAAGNSLGGWLGARTSISKGERWIAAVLNTVLVAFIVKLLFF